MIKLLILALLLQGCSVLQLQTMSTGLLLADWEQTKEISSNDNFQENNYILGKSPSRNRINLYFGTIVATNLLVGEVIEEKYAKWYYWTMVALETVVVTHNIKLGVKF